MEDLTTRIDQLTSRLKAAEAYLHIDEKRVKLTELEKDFLEPGFWNDPQTASRLTKQASDIRSDIDSYGSASALLDDARTADELAQSVEDEDLHQEATTLLDKLERRINELEMASWFSGELDSGDAIVSVNPGQGGLEAQDWAEMLFKMYTRYAQRHNWKVEVLDSPAGEVIGIEHATFIVSGRNSYGMLSGEAGVHRLVRISPTDEKKRRHTTFAGVEVLPVLPEEIEVEINQADLRIDVYRSSGPGGQSVNTTDSAVRITHVPTNTVVTCQNEKSQLQNKESAMKILRARLYEMEKERRETELQELRGPKHEASWGNQIRNYVLYPYQLVKDVRTGVETGNVDAVLDGDLDQFIISFLRTKAEE